MNILVSLRFLLLSMVIFGGIYTIGITMIGQLLFSEQANGSLVRQENQVVGSSLIGQSFEEDLYFHIRTQEVTHLSPRSLEHETRVEERIQTQLANNPTQDSVPIDLVTGSASGIDPQISVEAAMFQVDRVSKIRELQTQEVIEIIQENTQKDWFSERQFVNVLKLNLSLDERQRSN